MASSLSTRAPIVSKPPIHTARSLTKLSFRLSPKPKLKLFTKGLKPGQNHSTVSKAQLNSVSIDGSTNSAPSSSKKSEAQTSEQGYFNSSKETCSAGQATEETIRAFMTQVSSLVKLVDSRDIVELELKQRDCELRIRKKEALPQPAPAPVVMMHSPSQPAAMPPTPAVGYPAPTPPAASPTPAKTPPPSSSVPQAAKSSLPSIKCPMAGTFYRSPAPGEAPFVKVGDKVQKGQVLCIVEAMKLMNEIEADRSGTIVEILVEDGKPVSLDMPLFLIQP